MDLTLIAVAVVVVAAAGVVGYRAAYQSLYSPSAFVVNYLDLLAGGRAADALQVPGVGIDSSDLEAAGVDVAASDALLRSTALAPLTDARVVKEETDGAITRVSVEYQAGGHPGSTVFEVEQDGWIGFLPSWRFAKTPLAVVDLTVLGAMQFTVNGFTMDKRQVSAAGVEADPAAPVPLLVFTPGLYSISVDTSIAATPGVAVLADAPLTQLPIDVQAQPTESFVQVVQEKVDGFLTQCAQQQVLQPTSCPFGRFVQNRIDEPPTWSIVKMPQVTVLPSGANWIIPNTEGTAHIEVDVTMIADDTKEHLSEDVPFVINGTITILPDGRASIVVTGPDTR